MGKGFVSCPTIFSDDYLQLPHVRSAIGAIQTYIELNPTVGIAFDSTGDDARELDILLILNQLLHRNVRVTLYAGDADYECNWLGVEAVASAIRALNFENAGCANITTSDNIVHGQVKQAGPFSFVRVYEAGHAVGAFQPLPLQEIFRRTMSSFDLATGSMKADEQYVSVGEVRTTYRERNETVQDRVWLERATYDYITNLPSLEDFQPSWDGGI